MTSLRTRCGPKRLAAKWMRKRSRTTRRPKALNMVNRMMRLEGGLRATPIPSATDAEGEVDAEADAAEPAEADAAKVAEADAAEPDEADASKPAPSSEGPSDAAPKPAAVFDFDDEHEAVPVIPREAQAAAAKPGPISFDGTDTLVLPSDAQPKHFGLDRPDLKARKRKRIFIALCCVIAVLVIAACVLAYVRFGGQAGQESAQQQVQTQQQAPAASSEENEKPETKAGDDAAKASAEAEALARAAVDADRGANFPNAVERVFGA